MNIHKIRTDIYCLPSHSKCHSFFQASKLMGRSIYKIFTAVLVSQRIYGKKMTPQKPLVKSDKVNKTLAHPLDWTCYIV